MTYDYLVIGAGIVGAAVSAEIARRKPGARIVVAEKEADAAWHQTGRNSGVVHSGVYYTPGSRKARFCREGMAMTEAFCAEHNVGYEARGKLLVATSDVEERRLDGLEARAVENGVRAIRISRAGLARLEPAITGRAALHIPATAITDYAGITRALLALIENAGNTVRFNAPVTAVQAQGDGYIATVGGETISVGQIISCSGLASDRVARMLGVDPGIRILPFRGEYFVLPSRLNTIVQRLIYPVPDPQLPFLGVHLTPMIDGTVTVGPNAVLSLAREKYGHFSFELRDAVSALGYPGLWKMLARYPRATLQELRGSLFKRAYLQAVRKYCPQVRLSDLAVYRSANRAQAMQPDGKLVDDFLIERMGGITVILNAPSPAATGAMPIAREIVENVL
jgi:L-2-hydroxyglutarate oxidase